MLAAALPAAISAGASLLGGLFQKKENEKVNRQNQEMNERNIALQKEFAQSGIQWKVKDAEAAGVHPLFALGANTMSYSPSTVGATPNSFDFIGEAGQNVGRAIQATQDKVAQAAAIKTTQLQLDGLQLDNDLKRAQLASAVQLATQGSAPPGIPSPWALYGIDGQAGTREDLPWNHKATQLSLTTNLRFGGRDIIPDNRFSDAEAYEARYGEMSDFIAGPINAYMDWYRNVGPILERNVYSKLRR